MIVNPEGERAGRGATLLDAVGVVCLESHQKGYRVPVREITSLVKVPRAWPPRWVSQGLRLTKPTGESRLG